MLLFMIICVPQSNVSKFSIELLWPGLRISLIKLISIIDQKFSFKIKTSTLFITGWKSIYFAHFQLKCRHKNWLKSFSLFGYCLYGWRTGSYNIYTFIYRWKRQTNWECKQNEKNMYEYNGCIMYWCCISFFFVVWCVVALSLVEQLCTVLHCMHKQPLHTILDTNIRNYG